jgi:phosphate-selective porin OprO and OprP
MLKDTMNTLAKAAIIVPMILAFGNTLVAEDSTISGEVAALREQIAQLQTRLDAIEKKQSEAKIAEAKPAEEKPTDVTVSLGNKSAFSAITRDKRYSFQVKLRLQTDFIYFPDDDDGTDKVYIRRALITFKGSMDKLNWVLTPNLVGGTAATSVDDAWLEYCLSEPLHLWAGRFPTLEGWEMYQSNGKTLFIERALPSGLTTGREIGVMGTGVAMNKVLNYGVAVIDGALDGNTQLNNDNLGDQMDFVGKLTVTPFAPMKDSALAGLTVGLSGSAGKENVSLTGDTDKSIKYKTAGRNTFLQVTTGVLVKGDRSRLNPQMSYYYGPFGFVSEYMDSSYEMIRNNVRKDITNSGWMAQASWVITGEKASANGVKPAKPIGDCGWGAFELGLRFDDFSGDDKLFEGASADRLVDITKYTQNADSWGIALKWYLTENFVWSINYVETDFSGKGADRDSEQAVMSRFQVEF